MKTLIAIIGNNPGEKSTFGSSLSKKTGIPVFDSGMYNAKYGANTKVWLLSNMELKTNVILDNSNAPEVLKLSKSFGRTIVFLPMGENNKLTFGWLGQISKKPMGKTWVSNRTCPDDIKNKAESINEINSDLVLYEDLPDRENHLIWRITEALKK